jgi:hypothetical protein
VLLFPFYNADNASNTYFHVVNATSSSRAVKIRYNEYLSGSVALEWNLYLAPYDVFPMAIAADAAGSGATVVTADDSCTVPRLGTANGSYSGTTTELSDGSTLRSQPFVPFLFASDAVSSNERTLMGSLEVIEMGVVDSSVDVTKCDELATSWESGDWSTDPTKNMTAPTGGLSGNGYFIQVESAYSTPVLPTAINGWSTTVQHKGPGSMLPTLDQGVKTATVDGQLVDYSSKANGGILATGALLAADTVLAEVTAETSIAASTDIVLSFPTKKYHVSGSTALAPFTAVYDGTKEVSTSCEEYTLSQYDRSGDNASNAGSFGGAQQGGIAGDVCDNLSVVQFASSSALGVGSVSVPVGFSYQAGVAKFASEQVFPASDNGVTITGLPVLSFSSTAIRNGAFSYGYGSPSKTLKSMTITSGS